MILLCCKLSVIDTEVHLLLCIMHYKMSLLSFIDLQQNTTNYLILYKNCSKVRPKSERLVYMCLDRCLKSEFLRAHLGCKRATIVLHMPEFYQLEYPSFHLPELHKVLKSKDLLVSAHL